MSDKYFLKAYAVDTEKTPGGIITPKTELLPFYGSVKDDNDIDTLGVGRESIFNGTGAKRVINDHMNNTHHIGNDLYHGASGNAYIKDRAWLNFEPEQKDDIRYHTEAYRNDSYNSPEEETERLRKVIMHLMNTFTSGNSRNLDKSPVLLLCSAPEDAIVTLDDLENNNFDGQYDTPNEVQVKYYTPKMQLPFDNSMYTRSPESFKKWSDLFNNYFNYKSPDTISDEHKKYILKDMSNDYRKHKSFNNIVSAIDERRY